MLKRYQAVWRAKYPMTFAIVWLGICFHASWSNQAQAETQASSKKPSAIERRSRSRIGVSAVVLPSCIVPMGNTLTHGHSHPVQMRCTPNTRYVLGLNTQLGASASNPSSTPRGQRVIKQGNGYQDPSLLVAPKTSIRTVETGKTETTILLIEF